MAKIPSLRHMVIAILILGMALFSPRHLYAAFESDILSPLQNAAGGFPFSVYGNSLSVLSDPTILSSASPLFGAGCISRKFGLKNLTKSVFVIGGNYKDYGIGVGVSKFGNLAYHETILSVSGTKNLKEILIVGFSFQFYQLGILNYGQDTSIGTKLSARYKMNSQLEAMMSILNANRPVIGQSNEKLPQVISGGLLMKPSSGITGQVSFIQDTEFPISTRFGLIWEPVSHISIAIGKVHLPNIFTTGGMITIKNFRIEIGYLSYANLGLITYQTGISYSRMP
jgi:hypothetical protein